MTTAKARKWSRNGAVRAVQQAYRTEYFWLNLIGWVIIAAIVIGWLVVVIHRAMIGY